MPASSTLLIDTDVLIDYLRGQASAIGYIESLSAQIYISSITVAELYAGVREGRERKVLERFLSIFWVVPIDQNIAEKGGLYRRDFFKSHNVGLADAIIAATAEVKGATLVTLNAKHFPMISNLMSPYAKN